MPVKNPDFNGKREVWANSSAVFDGLAKYYAGQMAGELLRVTKRNTPVDTGHLRRMWMMGPIDKTLNGIEVSVYNATNYVFHVEYGHRVIAGGKYVGYIPGQFFFARSNSQFRPAFRRMSKDFQKAINDTLGGGGK